jgi:hypothetical protein
MRELEGAKLHGRTQEESAEAPAEAPSRVSARDRRVRREWSPGDGKGKTYGDKGKTYEGDGKGELQRGHVGASLERLLESRKATDSASGTDSDDDDDDDDNDEDDDAGDDDDADADPSTRYEKENQETSAEQSDADGDDSDDAGSADVLTDTTIKKAQDASDARTQFPADAQWNCYFCDAANAIAARRCANQACGIDVGQTAVALSRWHRQVWSAATFESINIPHRNARLRVAAVLKCGASAIR